LHNAGAQSTDLRPMTRAVEDVRSMLMKWDFDKIDRISEEARRKNIRTSDGQPMLAAIYTGVTGSGSEMMIEDMVMVRRNMYRQWLKRNPNSVTAKLALAYSPVSHAWQARGTGYASTVTEERWKLFRERLEEGRNTLEALDAKAKDDPGWYECMLDVGRSQGWPRKKFDAVFTEGVGKYPDYLPLYFLRMVFYSPNWYGSLDDQKRVIEEAVARTRGNLGETLYARLNWQIQTKTMFGDGQADWPRMRSGFERIMKDYPDRWNLNNFGRFACMAGDLKTLRNVVQKIGADPVPFAWFDDIGYYQDCREAAGRR
jgi:hypothetical protein